MDPARRAKILVRRRLGLWPALDARNKTLRFPATLRNRDRERREVARLRPPVLPQATVAVIMPTYRRPERLREALASVLAQTFSDFAVLIVDDGGGLPELPIDARVTALSLLSNTGTVGVVRNVGIRLSQSPLLAFLDDDNTWLPDHLATLVTTMQAQPTLLGAYTSVLRVAPDGTAWDTLATEFDRNLLRDKAYIDMNALMVRRCRWARFSTMPRDGQHPPAEDWELVWRLSRHGPLRHVDRVTVRYLLNDDSYFARWHPPEDGA